jgi:hypothetical protein
MREMNEITIEYGNSRLAHIKLVANRPIYHDDGTAECPICNIKGFDRRGIKTHILHCKGETNE